MKLLNNRLGLFFFFLVSALNASAALSDIMTLSGGATLVSEDQHKAIEQNIILSAPKRISNALVIEKQETVHGDLHVRLYQLKSGEQLSSAFKRYIDEMSAKGDILFQCEKRACGSSNYWANKIFGEHKLYGRDSDQYYLVSRTSTKQSDQWTSVYIVQNGLKQRYIYELSVVVSNGKSDEAAEQLGVWVNGAALKEGEIAQRQIASITKYLESTNVSELYLVVYADKDIKPTPAFWKQLDNKFVTQSNTLKEGLGDAVLPINKKILGPLHGDASFENLPIWFRLYAY